LAFLCVLSALLRSYQVSDTICGQVHGTVFNLAVC